MCINERLSSDNLFHFKQDINVVKLILQYGFRHNLWNETIPYRDSEQHNFIVCFCDIKIEDAEYHRQCYGNNSIVLSKEWGIRNGVSPVRYIHDNSPGTLQSYNQSKNRFRDIRQRAGDHPDTVAMDYSIFSVLLDQGVLTRDSIDEDIKANPNIPHLLENLEQDFTGIFDTLNTSGQNATMAQFLRSLINRISNLHNELERRDAFMKIYSDDFTHPANGVTIDNKILYDEREWRSIKFPDRADYENAINNGFLPPNYNLTFSDDDVIAILCENQNSLDELRNFIINNDTLLDRNLTVDKIQLISDYQE